MAKKKTAAKRPAKKKTTAKRKTAKKVAPNKTGNGDDAEMKKRAQRVIRGLAKTYPDVTCALHHKSPYELLVATILSAQCTDERVNMTTPALFEQFPDFEALAKAKQPVVEKLIKSTGFFRNKATNIIGMAKAVVERHGGELPTDIDVMVDLPGVGRKTANVVLGTWYGLPTGVVVDTHVKRISNLLGPHDQQKPGHHRTRPDGDPAQEGVGRLLAPHDSSRPADLCGAATKVAPSARC